MKKILSIFIVLILIIGCSSNEKKGTDFAKSTYTFDDRKATGSIIDILEISPDAIYYYEEGFVDKDVPDRSALVHNTNSEVIKRNLEGNEEVIIKDLGEVMINNFTFVDDNYFFVTYNEIDEDFYKYSFKISMQKGDTQEVLYEDKASDTSYIPKLYTVANKVYALIDNLKVTSDNQYEKSTTLYNLSDNKVEKEIEKTVVATLDDLKYAKVLAQVTPFNQVGEYLVITTNQVDKASDQYNSVMYLFNGNATEEIEAAGEKASNAFFFNDVMYYISGEVDKTTLNFIENGTEVKTTNRYKNIRPVAVVNDELIVETETKIGELKVVQLVKNEANVNFNEYVMYGNTGHTKTSPSRVYFTRTDLNERWTSEFELVYVEEQQE